MAFWRRFRNVAASKIKPAPCYEIRYLADKNLWQASKTNVGVHVKFTCSTMQRAIAAAKTRALEERGTVVWYGRDGNYQGKASYAPE